MALRCAIVRIVVEKRAALAGRVFIWGESRVRRTDERPDTPGPPDSRGRLSPHAESPLLAHRTREKWGTRLMRVKVKVPTLSQKARQGWGTQ